jgi:hypothetical protein
MCLYSRNGLKIYPMGYTDPNQYGGIRIRKVPAALSFLFFLFPNSLNLFGKFTGGNPLWETPSGKRYDIKNQPGPFPRWRVFWPLDKK